MRDIGLVPVEPGSERRLEEICFAALIKVQLNNMADRLASVLETYRGREKIMRLLQYASFLASGGLHKVSCEATGEKFRIFAEAMSECRTVLRLFDDAAMISFARSYGTGKEVIKRKRGKRERYQLLCLRQQPRGGYLGQFLLGMCRWPLRAPTPL